MAEKSVDSEGKTVKELFKDEVVYSMPFFQRGYVWKEDNLEEYWENLESLIKPEANPNDTSFLGALVLQEDTSKGENSTGPDRYIVIDGQQRLTTFYLTLLALLVYAMERRQEIHKQQKDEGNVDPEDLEVWGTHAKSPSHRTWLFSQEESNCGETKLIPSLSDHPQFDSILSELNAGLEKLTREKEKGTPKLLGDNLSTTGKLFVAYTTLQNKIHFFIEGKKKDAPEQEDVYSKIEQRERYDKIRSALNNKTVVVQIIAGLNLSAYEIFDRLNTSGVRLGTLDWVRNDVFGRLPLKKNKRVEDKKFSASVWRPFEKELKDVSKITDTRPSRRKSEEAKKKEDQKKEMNQSENFFKAYGSITMKNNFKVRDEFGCLRRYWDAGIIKEKLSLYEKGHYLYGDAEVIIEELKGHLPSYLALCAGKKPDGIDKDLWELIESMKWLSFPELTYPFLMSVIRSSIEGKLPVVNAIQAFKIVESFLVRRTLAGQDRGGLTPVFKNLWTNCGAEEMNPESILQNIKERAGTHFYENDDEVEDYIYKVSVDGKDGVRYILTQYEKSFWKGDHGIKVALPECEIDHVMPKAKIKGKGSKANEEENVKLHTLGNLTLLDPGINRLKSARELEKEKKDINKMSVKELLQDSSLSSVKDLLKDFNDWGFDNWGVQAIDARGGKLADWVRDRWPLTPEKFYPQNTQAKRAKPKSRR